MPPTVCAFNLVLFLVAVGSSTVVPPVSMCQSSFLANTRVSFESGSQIIPSTDPKFAAASCCASSTCTAWMCQSSRCTIGIAKSDAMYFGYTSGIVNRSSVNGTAQYAFTCAKNSMPIYYSGSQNSNPYCTSLCAAGSFLFAGTQRYDCHCGNDYNSTVVSPCTDTCPGDGTFDCGSNIDDGITISSTGATSWTCAASLPDMTITTPTTSTILSSDDFPVTVSVAWSYTVSPFYWNCWCTNFSGNVATSNGTIVATMSPKHCPFRTNGTQTNSSMVMVVPNSASTPNYIVNVFMGNARDTSLKSASSTFCVANLPSAATPISPTMSYVITHPSLANLTWLEPVDWGFPCGANDKKYQVYFGPNFNMQFIGVVATTWHLQTGLSSGILYSWKIVPQNGAFNSTAFPTTVTFTTCFSITPQFALSPASDGITYGKHNASVTLSWVVSNWPSCASTVTSRVRFNVYASQNVTASDLVASNLTSKNVTLALGGGTWHWRVAAVFDGIESSISATSTLLVKTCNDGSIDLPYELCDGGTGCTTDCVCGAHWTANSPANISCKPHCGDNFTIANEECDGGAGCTTQCTCDASNGFFPFQPASLECNTSCGDGQISGWEECEVGGFGCSPYCRCKPCFASQSPVNLNCVTRDGPFCTGNTTRITEFMWCTNGTGAYQPCPFGNLCKTIGYRPGLPCEPTTCGDGYAIGAEQCDGGPHCTPIYCLCATGFMPTTPVSTGCIPMPSSAEYVASNDPENKGGLNAGAVIGIAIGGSFAAVLIIGGAIVAVAIIYTRKKSGLKTGSSDQPQAVYIVDSTGGIPLAPYDGIPMVDSGGMVMNLGMGGGMTGFPTSMVMTPVSVEATEVAPPAGDPPAAAAMQ